MEKKPKEEKSRPFVSFKMDKTFYLVIGYWFCEISYRTIKYIEWEHFKLMKNDSETEYLLIILFNFADLFSLFVLLYLRLRRKLEKCQKEKEEKDNEISNISYISNIYGNPVNTITLISIIKLIGIVTLDLLARSVFYIYHSLFNKNYEVLSQQFAIDFISLFDIVIRFFLYGCLIKKKEKNIYKQQIFAIIAIIIIFVLLIELDITYVELNKEYNLKDCIIYVAILFPRSILFPLADTLIKIYMHKYYILPWQYMGSRSIIEFIFLAIITSVLYAKEYFHISYDIFTINFFIIASLYILANFIKAALLIHVIYYYSSIGVAFLIISEPLSGLIYNIINSFKEKENISMIITIIEIILVILIGIATMIYAEIIEINKCGFDKNRRNTIYERGLNDTFSIKDNDYFISTITDNE